MNPQIDSSGHTYFEVGNVRITCIPQNGNGRRAIRIRAYRGQGDAMHPGPDIEVPTQAEAYDFIRGLMAAFGHLGV